MRLLLDLLRKLAGCDECFRLLEALRGLVASIEMTGRWDPGNESAVEILAEVDEFLEER